jgi:hypothetical protein
MSLCPACSSISVATLTSELELDDLPPWLWDLRGKPNTARGMVHLSDARDLTITANEGCPLCELILQATLQELNIVSNARHPSSATDGPLREHYAHDIHQLQRHLVPQPIYLVTNYDPIKTAFPEEGAPGSWHIRGVKVYVPVDHLVVVVGRIRLYAARGERSCDRLS